MIRRIVLVDDCVDVHLLVQRALRRTHRADLTLEICGDPREALARVPQNPPDLLLSDVNMPFIDGPELVEQLRAAGYEGPAILISNLPCQRTNAVTQIIDKEALLADLAGLLARWLPER